MKRILLARSSVERFVFVDDSDYEWAKQRQWYWRPNDGYAGATLYMGYDPTAKRGRYKHRLMHRLLLDYSGPLEIDHRDGNRLNNQRANLRIATSGQNKHNSRLRADNTSGYKGVTYSHRLKRWCASLVIDKHDVYLGSYADKHDAALAYNLGALIYFGEFARLNEV